MLSLRDLLEFKRPRERRQPVDIAPVVLPPRQAVVVVVAYPAYEVRMRLIDVDHGAPSLPSKRRRSIAPPVDDFHGFRST
jgi:hypothetical protein